MCPPTHRESANVLVLASVPVADTNKTLIAATPNTVGAMVTVMTRNKGVASVQEYACAAIWNLALHGELDVRDACANACGGPRSLCLTVFVYRSGCRACIPTDTLKPAIRATYGLIEALDTARVTHPNVAAVQENAVGALSELQGGCPAVATAASASTLGVPWLVATTDLCFHGCVVCGCVCS